MAKSRENSKGISVFVDKELHAEITEYLREHEMTMGDFIAIAAQDELHPRSPELDPELQAEVMAHLEGSDIRLEDFIALAVQNELHPKATESEVNMKENTRTLAFQVPENLFQRIKEYLARNNMTQRAFVLGLIEKELDKDEELVRKQHEESQAAEGEAEQDFTEDEDMQDEPAPATEDTLEPDNYTDFAEVEGVSFPEESEQEHPPDVMQDEAADFDESPPDQEYVEGEMGAAIEIAPGYDFEDDQPPFLEQDDEEGQEFGMSMGY